MSDNGQDDPAGPRSDGGTDLSEDSGAGTPPDERSDGPTAEAPAAAGDLWAQSAVTTRSDAEGIRYELDVYAEFLDALLAEGYEFVGFEGSIEEGQIALRHDVDISLERAAAMARVEAERGVRSTYLLLVTAPLYDLLAPESREHLRTILEAGHDVGLHFDPHYYWDEEPPVEALERRVLADRTALERALEAAVDADGSLDRGDGVPSGDDGSPESVAAAATSIHQPPDWALGVDYEAFESTYRPAYFLDVEYVSDSGGKWRTERPFTDGVPDAMQLLVHPGLWGSDDRPMATILEEHTDRCRERVQRYVGPFGG